MNTLGQGATGGATAGAGYKVETVQGTIENQQVDALVSPVVGHDPLSTAVGKALSKMTGEQLKAMFYKEGRGLTLPSEIVVVEVLPGLKCKAVIFLNLLGWDNNLHGTAVQVLRQGVKNILDTCHIRGYSSVAFPLLGTGALLHFPHDIATAILLEEVYVYGQNWASISPFLVQIIVHPNDKGLQSIQGVWHQTGFKNVSPAQGTFYQCISVRKDHITAMMGGVKLQILQNDIINAGTDVIVNTTDFTNHQSGVSKAILKAAGLKVYAEFSKVGIPANLICTTAGGQLGCKEIIHARFRCDTQRICNTCKEILQICENKGYGSVAFPAINTGEGGMNPVEACKAMLDGFDSAIRDLKPYSLSLIRIIVLKKRVFKVFRSELEIRCLQDVPRHPGLSGYTSALALELPQHWETMHGVDFKKVELDPNSLEYQEVAKGLHKTTNYTIHKIERVQNVYLWHAFSICRYRILSKNGKSELGEKFLYYGTCAASCKAIERDRFDRSFAGLNGACYGKGVYFAVNASYSADKFSPADDLGLKRMYAARVLTGRYTLGNASMIAPPPRGADATDCFDSLVNNQQHPTIFVIFHDDQAYPEYLITFS